MGEHRAITKPATEAAWATAGQGGMGAGPAAERAAGPCRDGFADDAAQDAVILSVQDIRAAQEAIALARADREAGRDPARPDQPLGPPDEPLGPPDQPAGAASPGLGRPPGAGGPAVAREGQSRGPPPRANTTPSWGTVLATTIRLWWQRRVRARTASPRWRVITVVVLVAVLLRRGRSRTGADPRQRADHGQRVPGAQRSGYGRPGGQHGRAQGGRGGPDGGRGVAGSAGCLGGHRGVRPADVRGAPAGLASRWPAAGAGHRDGWPAEQ